MKTDRATAVRRGLQGVFRFAAVGWLMVSASAGAGDKLASAVASPGGGLIDSLPALEATNAPVRPRTYAGRSGSWGEIEYVRILLERPDAFVSVNYELPPYTGWTFPGWGVEKALQLLRDCGLSPAQLPGLFQTNRWNASAAGCQVLVDKDTLLRLPDAARRKIYEVLASFPENGLHARPFTFNSESVDEWFEDSDLSPQTISLVKGLAYMQDSSVCFSDLSVVFAGIDSPAEKRRLLKTLSRQQAVLMNLKITPAADVRSLVGYWGRGGRAKDIEPLLESLVKVREGVKLDVAHLLPPFARRRLYTYPYPTEDASQAAEDCFWTAFNFFNDMPDDRFRDPAQMQQILTTDYYPVRGDLTYGDVVMLVDTNRLASHAAVYIADDKVFTKNGTNYNQPWLFMDLQDMAAYYPGPTPLRIQAYRQKKL
jgi:hypothetical protein